MMKKLVSFLLAALMLTCLITPLSLASAEAKSDVVLTLATEWTGGPNATVATDSIYFQEWMKATGITFETVPASAEQLSMRVATDTLPDIIQAFDTSSFLGSNVYSLIADDVIMPLNEMIEAGHCPNYMSALQSIPEADKLAKSDDGLYPGFYMLRAEDSYKTFGGMLVRQDWLTELGLETPATVADWDTVLRAFKAEKGATSALSGMWAALDGMRNAYGVTDAFYVEDGAVKYGPIESNYELFLQQMNAWMIDGILDPDIFTESADTVYAKIANNEIGALYGYTGSTFNKILTMDNPGMDFVAAPNPIYSEDTPRFITATYPLQTTAFMLSATCQDPVLACQLIDWIYSPEGTMLSTFGVEGVSYTYDENGTPVFTDVVLNNPDGYSRTDAQAIYAGEANKPYIVTAESMIAGYTNEKQQDSLVIWECTDGDFRVMPPLSLTAEETAEMSALLTDIDTYTSESRLNFIYGNTPLDAYDSFVSTLQSLGIDRCIEIYQAAYDRYQNR